MQVLLATTALSLLPFAALAADNWTGGTSSDWNDASNWSGSVPNVSIETRIDATAPYLPVIDGGFAGTGYLYVGYDDSGALIVENGATLTSGDVGSIGYNAGSTGRVTVTGAGSSWYAGDITVDDLGGDGTLTIVNGGSVGSRNGWIGNGGVGPGASGTVTVSGPGSNWTIASVGGAGSGQLVIAYFDPGSLTIEGGGAVSDDHGIIGFGGGTGTVTVTGDGSTWTNSGDVTVGSLSSGTLNIEAGGAVTNDNGIIGDLTGSSGQVTVTGDGSSWTNTGNVFVGNNATGTLDIEDGATVSDTIGIIGSNDGSSGTVTVTGDGSRWTNSSNLLVGDRGTGALNIEAGGSVSDVYGVVGGTGFTASQATVTGNGSTWTNSIALNVGGAGGATLTIADGATVSAGTTVGIGGTSGTINIGAGEGEAAAGAGFLDTPAVAFDGGTGKIVFNHTSSDYLFTAGFTGDGAIEHLAGDTTLSGDSSDFTGQTYVQGGTLTVTGHLGGDSGFVGAPAYSGAPSGATGNAVITGTGADWTVSGLFYVGYDGDIGTLTISDGASVHDFDSPCRLRRRDRRRYSRQRHGHRLRLDLGDLQ